MTLRGTARRITVGTLSAVMLVLSATPVSAHQGERDSAGTVAANLLRWSLGVVAVLAAVMGVFWLRNSMQRRRSAADGEITTVESPARLSPRAAGVSCPAAARFVTVGSGPEARRSVRRRKVRVAAVFAVSTAALLAVWTLLAVLYGALGGVRSADADQVIAALTSSSSHSGSVDTSAILGTPDYFHVAGRTARSLGVDPGRNLVVLVSLDTHVVDLPDPAAWASMATLGSGGDRVSPLPNAQVGAGGVMRLYATAFRSDHHQTIALQFPRNADGGAALLDSSSRTLRLGLPALDEDEPATMSWDLPLQRPISTPAGGVASTASSLGGLLAIMAGLLVIFSPCAIHLTAVFLPLVTGLGMNVIAERSRERRFRVRLTLLGLAFVGGFVLLYTAFGAAAGLAGSFFTDTTVLRPWITPLRILTGAFVVYLALQNLGLFRLPFVVHLRLPWHPEVSSTRHGFVAAALAGATVSAGCLVCVGGTLLASLLLFAGTTGSPLAGAAILFLFALGVSIPFLMTTLALDRVLPRLHSSLRFVRYSGALAAAVMLVVGLLVMSGTESIFERLAPGLGGGAF